MVALCMFEVITSIVEGVRSDLYALFLKGQILQILLEHFKGTKAFSPRLRALMRKL